TPRPGDRSGAAKSAGAPRRGTRPAPSVTPAPRAASGSQAMDRPPLSIVPPLAGDPEFNVEPAPAATPASQSKVLPLPLPQIPRAAAAPVDDVADDDAEAAEPGVDANELARA